MSLSLVPQETFRVVDPRLDFGGKSYYAIPQGAKKISVQSEKTAGAVTGTNWSFNFYTPSPEIITSRCVKARASYVLTIDAINDAVDITSAPNAGLNAALTPRPLVDVGVTDAPRAYPIHNTLQTMNVTINGNCNVVMNTSDVFSALQHVNGRSLYRTQDAAPWFPDNTLEYSSIFAGSARNPLGTAGKWEWDAPRGAYEVEVLSCQYLDESGTQPIGSVVSGGVQLPVPAARADPGKLSYNATRTVVRVTTCEPIMMSPFLWTCDGQGFRGVQSMNFQFMFMSKPDRLWSHITQYYSDSPDIAQPPPGPPGTAIRIGTPLNRIVSIQPGNVPALKPQLWYGHGTNPTPDLLLEYLTVPVTIPVPLVTTLPYREIARYTGSGSGVTLDKYANANAYSNVSLSGATFDVDSGSLYLTAIPEAVILYVRPTNDVRDQGASKLRYIKGAPVGITLPAVTEAPLSPAAIADGFYPIDKLSIQWNNSTGLLETAQPQNLYEYSKKNGVDLPWVEWSGRTLEKWSDKAGNAQGLGRSTTGAVFMARFGYEIPLDEGQAPGLRGSWNFQVKVGCRNTRMQFPITYKNYASAQPFGQTSVPADYSADPQVLNGAFLQTDQQVQLFMVFIYPGTVTCSMLSTQKDIGIVSPGDIVQSMIKPDVPAEVLRAPYGGASFLSDRREALRGMGMVTNNVPIASGGAALSGGAMSSGGPAMSGGELIEPASAGAAGTKRARTMTSGDMSGGKSLSKGGLASRLRSLQDAADRM